MDSKTTLTTLDAALGRIHNQDCIAGMNALPAGSVDLAFADPPFNIGYDYDVYHDRKAYDVYLDWSRQWIGAVHRVLKPDGTFWLAIGDEYAAELKIESQKAGFHIRSWVIWYYTFGVNCKTKFSRSHAHLFHFVKDPKRFTFRANELENRVPSARQLVYGDIRANPNGRLPDDTWILRPQSLNGLLTDDEDTWILRPQDLAGHFTAVEENWYFPRVAGTFKERAGFHGCQMPEQLLGRIIRICSNRSDVVLDPFSGSATTLAVARKLGRKYLGFELSTEYVKRGTERLMAIKVGDRLEGAVEPTISAPTTVEARTAKNDNRSPLEQILAESAKAWEARSRQTVVSGLIDAFSKISSGYSVDRVVADPELNAALKDECVRIGLPGDIRWWNRMLFRARKAGQLAAIPTSRRTELSWERCDSFLFASEIAWRQMLDQGCESLDEVLCDPDSASEFDRLAALLVPDFTSLDYRWGALKLRKESKRARARAGILDKKKARLQFAKSDSITGKSFSRIPDVPGVYLVSDQQFGKPLYAGESLCLRSRLQGQFRPNLLRTWKQNWGNDLSVAYFTAESETPLLLAYQSLCIAKHQPRLNIPEFATT